MKRASDLRPLQFSCLEGIAQDRIPPGSALRCAAPPGAEVLTYVLKGALLHPHRSGVTQVIQAGEFERMSAMCGHPPSEIKNASEVEEAYVLQAWMRARIDSLCECSERRRFCFGERRGALRLIAAPKGGPGWLRLLGDAFVYSGLLEPGRHVVHALGEKRSAWVHLLRGEVGCEQIALFAGDGAGIVGARAVSLTARQHSELLLFDLPS